MKNRIQETQGFSIFMFGDEIIHKIHWVVNNISLIFADFKLAVKTLTLPKLMFRC